MKRELLRNGLQILFVAVLIAVSFTSCKDDEEKPKTAPEVTTAEVIDVTTTTASGGGEIVSNGNSEITTAGLVYSSTNETPTISDSKTEEDATAGTFTSLLEDLNSGTTYYVRAYATNSIGTSYGDVVEFTTGNAVPLATDVSISGTPEVNKDLTATYTYTDSEDDAENSSTFKWYIATDDAGTGETTIDGAITLTYRPKDTDEFKYIRFGVTPKAEEGNITGIEVKSAFVGPITARTTVTFMYAGSEVTYGIVTGTTGRKWLDRNLGAPNVPNAVDDYENYGDVFQWGRGADGHQLVVRGGANNETTTGVNGTTTDLATTDTPGSLFILNSSSANEYDWRSTPNNNLWQGVNGTNNPCPTGWRVPTETEWFAETLPGLPDVYNTPLKLTRGGERRGNANGIFALNTRGSYSTSTVDPTNSLRVRVFYVSTTLGGSTSPVVKSTATACRCIKD